MHFPDGNDEVQMVGITASWSVATPFCGLGQVGILFLNFFSSVFCFFFPGINVVIFVVFNSG